MAVALLVQCGLGSMWVQRQSDKIDTLIEQQKELKAEVYHQGDATRDLALRDQKIDELARRVASLEHRCCGQPQVERSTWLSSLFTSSPKRH